MSEFNASEEEKESAEEEVNMEDDGYEREDDESSNDELDDLKDLAASVVRIGNVRLIVLFQLWDWFYY